MAGVKDLNTATLNACEADPTLKILEDGTLGDGRLVFDASARDALSDAANPHDINRNLRFTTAGEQVNHFLDAHLVGGARVTRDQPISPAA